MDGGRKALSIISKKNIKLISSEYVNTHLVDFTNHFLIYIYILVYTCRVDLFRNTCPVHTCPSLAQALLISCLRELILK
jgi:hypothetical protein